MGVIVDDEPTLSVIEVLFKVIAVSGVNIFILIVVLVAPSADLAVILTVPALTPLTIPLEETVAILLSLVDHVMPLLVTLAGAIVATTVFLLPTAIFIVFVVRSVPEVDLSVIEVAGCFTVTRQVAVAAPSFEVAVIVAVPAATAVIVPLDETLAIFSSDEDQVTVFNVAAAGVTVAEIVFVLPASREMLEKLRVTPVAS